MLDGQKVLFLCMISSGVPLGTVLTPLLFLCYINYLSDHVTSNVRLYADDELVAIHPYKF